MSPPSPQPEQTTIIETPRLFLRPLSAVDADAVFAIRSHPQVFTFTRSGKPQTRTESDEWLKQRLENGNCLSYCVEVRDSPHDNPTFDHRQRQDQVIGLTGAHRLPEVGYLFLPDFWGKGYATEALKAWIEWYWKAHPDGFRGKAYLEAMTGPEGAGSRNVLRKCGFRWYGEVRKEEDGVEEDGENNKEIVMLDVWRLEKPA